MSIAFRIPTILADHLRACAHQQDLTVSELLRLVVMDYIQGRGGVHDELLLEAQKHTAMLEELLRYHSPEAVHRIREKFAVARKNMPKRYSALFPRDGG